MKLTWIVQTHEKLVELFFNPVTCEASRHDFRPTLCVHAMNGHRRVHLVLTTQLHSRARGGSKFWRRRSRAHSLAGNFFWLHRSLVWLRSQEARLWISLARPRTLVHLATPSRRANAA